MAAQRSTPNYVLDEKLDTLLNNVQNLSIATARVEEKIAYHGETLKRHEQCIDTLKNTDKWFGGVNAALAIIAGVFGVSVK